jgi:hypothetical protein
VCSSDLTPTPGPVPPRPTTGPRHPVANAEPRVYQFTPTDYPYNVVSREEGQDEGFVRVDYTVEVDKPLTRDQAVNLAKKLVTEETTRNAVNGVSFVIRRKAPHAYDPKWVIWIDWAPGGIMSNLGNVPTGDYKTHKFAIILEGVQ